MNISYKLLGILQEIAPNGDAQQRCTEWYHKAQANEPDERKVAAYMAGLITDGYRHGNWPWTEMPK